MGSLMRGNVAVSLFALAAGMLGASGAQAQDANAPSVEGGEIIVTAQRRAQNLQDVPLAITVFSAEQTEDLGIKSVSDIARFTPNLNIRNTIGDALPTVSIRGVGSVAGDINDATSTPSAAFHVDEVYLGSPALLGFQLFDVEQIEVLKGPQGTLFGRNTTAGTLNIRSARPSSTFGAQAQLGYDSFNVFTASGYLTGALTDTLSGRIAATYSKGDTYYRRPDGSHDEGPDRLAARLLLDWRLGQASVLLNLHGGQDRSGVIRPHLIGYMGAGCNFRATGVQDPVNCVDGVGDPTYRNRYTVNGSRTDGYKIDNYGGSVRAEIPFGDVNFVSITAYENLDAFIPEEGDSSNIVGFFEYNEHAKVEQYSQEFRLSAQPNWGAWTAGLFAFREEVDTITNNYLFGGPLSDPGSESVSQQTTTSFAAFGQIEYKLTEKLELVTGLRATMEKKDYAFEGSLGDFFGGLIGLDPSVPFYDPARQRYIVVPQIDASKNWENLSGTLGLNYKVSPDLTLYVNARSGYKSGAYAGSAFGDPSAIGTPAKPEKLYAYEAGVKSMLADRKLRLNASFFYYDYSDLQVRSTVVVSGQPILAINNAEEARVYGLDADLNWTATDHLTIFAALGLSDAEFTKFSTIEPPALTSFDRSGQRLPNAPRVTATAGAKLTVPLAGGELSLLGTAAYRSQTLFSYLTDRQLDRNFRTGENTKFNARVSWSDAAEKVEIAAYIDNITNEAVPYQMFDGLDSAVEYLEPPQRVGVNLTYRY
jgi:iron complex outermembrane receptor protein